MHYLSTEYCIEICKAYHPNHYYTWHSPKDHPEKSYSAYSTFQLETLQLWCNWTTWHSPDTPPPPKKNKKTSFQWGCNKDDKHKRPERTKITKIKNCSEARLRQKRTETGGWTCGWKSKQDDEGEHGEEKQWLWEEQGPRKNSNNEGQMKRKDKQDGSMDGCENKDWGKTRKRGMERDGQTQVLGTVIAVVIDCWETGVSALRRWWQQGTEHHLIPWGHEVRCVLRVND